MREPRQGVRIPEEAKRIVRERYGKDSPEDIASDTGLTVTQVWGLASRMGIARAKPHKHTAENGHRGRPVVPKTVFDHRPLLEAFARMTITPPPKKDEN